MWCLYEMMELLYIIVNIALNVIPSHIHHLFLYLLSGKVVAARVDFGQTRKFQVHALHLMSVIITGFSQSTSCRTI